MISVLWHFKDEPKYTLGSHSKCSVTFPGDLLFLENK